MDVREVCQAIIEEYAAEVIAFPIPHIVYITCDITTFVATQNAV